MSDYWQEFSDLEFAQMDAFLLMQKFEFETVVLDLYLFLIN